MVPKARKGQFAACLACPPERLVRNSGILILRAQSAKSKAAGFAPIISATKRRARGAPVKNLPMTAGMAL
jgi:hypothetical protein